MTTPSRKMLENRLDSIEALLQGAAAVEMARRTAAAPYADRSAALKARAAVGELLDARAGAADDAAFRQFRALRAAVTEHIAAVAAGLPRVTLATPAAVRPSLALAWDIYEDISRAGEIAARNRLPRPGFVPSRPIELLAS